MRHLLFLFAVALTLSAAKPAAVKEDVWDRLARMLGCNPKHYRAAVSVRGETMDPGKLLVGDTLIRFDQQSGTETVLWKSERLRAPIPVPGGGTMILRMSLPGASPPSSEIWIVPASGEPRQVAAGTDVFALLDVTANGGGVRVLRLVREDEGKSPSYIVDELSLRTGKFTGPGTEPPLVLESLAPARATLLDGRLLKTANEPASSVMLFDLNQVGQAGTEGTEVRPAADTSGQWDADGIRFDPVWENSGSVLYVRSSR